MAQVNQGTVSGTFIKHPARALVLGVPFALIVLGVALGASVLLRPAASPGNTGAGAAFTSASTIEFRAGEHAVGVAAADPVVGPAAIEFRIAEHQASIRPAFVDPLLTPRAIEFRTAEHAVGR